MADTSPPDGTGVTGNPKGWSTSLKFATASGAWFRIAQDHLPSALVSIPQEIHTLNWRLHRRLP